MNNVKLLIQNAANSAQLGDVTSYRWLAAGFISEAYEFATKQGNFVLLQNKSTAAQDSDYRSYYANLKVVETIGYIHAPKAIYLSEDDTVIVITKVPGVSAVDVSSFSESDQQQIACNIADALCKLAVVRKSDTDGIYSSLGLTPPKVMSWDLDWKVYVTDRFEPYRDNAPSDARTEWIMKAMAGYQGRPHYSQTCFHHGDTSPRNVIIREDLHITLIDWGGSNFYESSPETEDYGLSYAFNHIKVMHKYRELILQRLCEQTNQNYKTYNEHIRNRSRDIKIADVVWAYWMYCQTSNGTIAESPQGYKQILDQRISEFEIQFGEAG